MKYFIACCLIILTSISSCKENNKKGDLILEESEIAERANNYYQHDQYLKAKLSFDTLILINPLKSDYYFRRGYSKSMLLNDDKGTIEDYLKAIHYGYKNSKSAYLNIGTIYRSNENYDSAIFYYNKSLELDSNFDKALKEKDEVLKLKKG